MKGDLELWTCLQSVKGLGPSRLKKLCETFRPISAIKDLTPDEIARIGGINPVIAGAICKKLLATDRSCDIPDDVDFFTISENGYPGNLYNIYDPPAVLYCKGSIQEADKNAVAIVGTRNPSSYGLRATETITGELVAAGFTIVSGLALGIDECAHETALRCGGRTIAVLASGLSDIYPRSNKKLSEEIIRNGALVSESYLSPPRFEKWSFPKRNRIISGLSLGTVVIEGAEDSGSLITADFALEQNREVFAVPGTIFSRYSIAPNNLIKNGAKLVQTVDDILEELDPRFKRAGSRAAAPAFDSEQERIIFDLMVSGPKNADMLCRDSGMDMSRLSSLLLSMQIRGIIKELPGRVFVSC